MERGEEQIADDVPAAVVLFADVVSFTDKAARHPPDVIVRFLNELFEKFDVLVRKHGLEKIKTIGDAYMVAGGLPEPKVGHIAAAADFALDLIAASASHFDPDDKAVKIRIGIHSGPVLAGVIGKTRFGYDLWGDTVNLASRLQGSAPPNSILVSKEVQADLADRFSFQHLGAVEFKGKGEVSTWLLNGRNDSASGEN